MDNTATCYAHSHPEFPGDPTRWQKLEAHSCNVADYAGRFADKFGSKEWAEVVARLHDIGKMHPEFQRYLMKSNGLDSSDYDEGKNGVGVNHSGTGAVFAMEKWSGETMPLGRTIAYIVAGHHAGLPDWHGGLDVRLHTEKSIADAVRSHVGKILASLPAMMMPPRFAFRCKDGDAVAYHLWVRMIFSCLVDADFLDTEMFMNVKRGEHRPVFPLLPELKIRFDKRLNAMLEHVPTTGLNKVRADVLGACRQAANSRHNLFSLTVPTGGGKTLSGTAFALDHAVKHGKSRIIYAIPYTSIIEQTADVLRKFVGAENLVEHHSSVDPEKSTLRLALASENWDAPVIVTTNVQLFESLYSAKPGRCRKLHNLVNSVIILDEAQLLPPEWLFPCVEIINRLILDYGVTVLLSTATQPALPHLCVNPMEIISDVPGLYAALQRTVIYFPPDIMVRRDWSSIAVELTQHSQSLCVVNRRRDCYDLWRLLPAGTIHLSALLCGAHRSRVIAEIKAKLATGESCRVISTQLVEAGVDIDFPIVYRALAGLDSINQAAGRCNREGKSSVPGEVHIFIPPKDAPPGLLRKGEQTTRELLSLADFDASSPAESGRYFKCYYNSINDMGENWWREHLVKDVNPGCNVQFRTAGDDFRFIKDASVPIIVRYGDSDSFITKLRAAGPKREIMRALQRYTVTVHPEVAGRLKAEGFVEALPDGILVQTDTGIYDENIGLNIFRDNYAPEELYV